MKHKYKYSFVFWPGRYDGDFHILASFQYFIPQPRINARYPATNPVIVDDTVEEPKGNQDCSEIKIM